MVWKDPRTCLTLPFWVEVLDETPLVVLLNRHPVEIASSAEKRNQLSRGHAFAVWERFLGDARHHRGRAADRGRRLRPTGRGPGPDHDRAGRDARRVGRAAAGRSGDHRDGAHPAAPASPRRDRRRVRRPDRDRRHSASSSRCCRELPPVSDSFTLPRPVPDPDPLSTELLALAGQVHVARRDERRGPRRAPPARRLATAPPPPPRRPDPAVHRGRRVRPLAPGEPTAMPAAAPATVTVHVASYNTARVDGAVHPLDAPLRRVVDFGSLVGDAGSTDGSLDDAAPLRGARLARARGGAGRPQAPRVAGPLAGPERRPLRGLQRLGRRVPRSRLARRPGRHRRATGAALVCARMQTPAGHVRAPGDRREAAARAAPDAVAACCSTSSRCGAASTRASATSTSIDPDAFGGKVAYDVGAAYFAALDAAGLTWAEMPPAWQSKFRHFGGLTWLKPGGRCGARRCGPASWPSSASSTLHLWRARASRWGDAPPG